MGWILKDRTGKGGRRVRKNEDQRRKVNGRKGVGRCERGRIIGGKAMEGRGWGCCMG